MVANVILYVELDGQIWMIMSDGEWLPVTDINQIDSDLPLVSNVETMLQMQDSGEFTFSYNGQTFVIDPQALHNETSASHSGDVQSQYNITSGSGLGFAPSLERDGDEVLADAGYQTRAGESTDSTNRDENDNNNNTVNDKLRGDAQTTIVIDSGDDDTLNQFEISTTPIYGTTVNIQDGFQVKVTITDSNGLTLTFYALVNNNSWSIGDVDLSSFEQGDITALVTISDEYGNTIDASTDGFIDTIASLDVHFENEAQDNVINQMEANNESLFGTVDNIEDGQIVSIVITDETGYSETFHATIIDGEWSLDEADLSAFEDGQLVAVATATDDAGNVASSTTTIMKDTQASITLHIDDGGDGWLNATEILSTSVSGSVSGVEEGQIVTITATDEFGNSVTITTTVVDGKFNVSDLDLSEFGDGEVTITATVSDVAGNPASVTETELIDTQATISLNINTHGDGVLNASEVVNTELSGHTTDVENGAMVTIVITDSEGNTLTFEATVENNTYTVEGDLSSLAEGELSAEATVTDEHGNTDNVTSQAEKDTLAEITINVETGGDNYLNALEIGSVTVSGSVSNVEDGNLVTITATDSNGKTSSIVTTVVDGQYSVSDLDLSGFSDGDFSVTATVTDDAGNLANVESVVQIDTQASITIHIDDGGDGWLNATEILSASVSGTVSGVEDGQIVTIVATDGAGNSMTITTTVVDGRYSVSDLDLSAFEDGEFTVTASVTDVAGNPTSVTDTELIDTQALISLNINSNGDGVLNASEVGNTELSGHTTDVEDGAMVTIVITDSEGNTLTFEAMVDNNTYTVEGDLSALAEGELSAEASVTDEHGNAAQATSEVEKDTLADITISIDSGDDNYLNAAEIAAGTKISGRTTNIENGQIVTLLISDQSGNEITVEVIIKDGVFEVDGLDLSDFDDGPLEVNVEASDQAGNSATATDSVVKDIEVSIDIDTDSNNGFSDYPGFDSEGFMTGEHTELGGTTTAEPGQVVTLTITDGTNSVSFDAVVDESGHWLVEDIDISSLDNSVPWDMQVDVNDIAGNSASDSMPTLNIPDQMFLSEENLNTSRDTATVELEINSENTTLSFTDNQPQLSALTSEGSSLFIILSDDGLSIEVRRESDGALVLTAVIHPESSSASVTLFAPLDHDIDSDTLLTELYIKAVQTDSDGTTETSVIPLSFNVEDSVPSAVDDNYTVTEAQTGSGNLLINDSAIDGSPSVNSVTFDGVTIEVSLGFDAVIVTDKGILTVSANGDWTFEAASNLDNSVDQEITFEYQIVDYDGDVSNATVVIEIVDGVAGQMDDVSMENDESMVNVETETKKTFTITAGSDDLDAGSIAFSDSTLSALVALGLESNGESITYSLNEAGNTITATNESGEIVFTLSLTAINDGADLNASATLTQHLPLDHTDSDEITLPLTITAVDSDGTEISKGDLNWTINDGADASISDNTDVSLDEADLKEGNVAVTGEFTVTPGSDETVAITFDISKQPSLTSGGQPILYALVGGILIAYTDDVDSPIFTVEIIGDLNSTTVSEFEYEFTLIEGIDQLDENGDNLESILFDIVVSVTDGDNDVTDQNLTIEVSDSGAATITVSNDDFEVTETPNTSLEDATISDSDSITITIEADQDPIVDIKLAVNTKDPVLLSDGTTLTQNGETVYWQASSDGNYQGVLEDGTVIFELTLPENINISAQTSEDVELEFTLVGSVDHDKDSGHDESLKITLPVVVIDSDGTEVGVDINVTIEDGDIPSLSVSDSLVVDEGDLLAGNGVSESEITYELVQGSDDVVAVEPLLAGQVIDGLTSNGQSVSFAETADSNGWWIASSNEGEVFKVRFNLDGTIEFKLLAAVDHPDSGEDILNISLDIQAIDADGDVSEIANVNIDIKDDVPDEKNTFIILEEGESKDLNLLEDPDSMGADGATVTKITADGVDYAPGDVIELKDADGHVYGTLTINADGTGTLVTVSTPHTGYDILDKVTYTVTDSDGDEVECHLYMDIADEAGKITISNTSTLEDESLSLSLVVSVGDTENGEQLVGVVFIADSLAGGTLTLNGVLLVANEDGDIILSAEDFELLDNGTYVPKGELVYHPKENSSDATQEVTLDIYAEISRTDGSDNEIVHNEIDLSVTSVADKPTWDDDNSTYEYTTVEDGDEQEIALSADLFDTDGSETLTYQIGDIDSGLILTINGVEISSGDVLSAEEIALIKVSTEKNVAGVLTFAITPIATEGDNHDVALGDEKIITINVQPVADVPDLVVKDVQGLEDEIVLLNEILNGQLNDNDGSETLSYIITVPEGWSVVAVDGDANVIDLGNGTYQVLGSDVESGAVGLLPEANASSSTGEFIFSAQAVATESSQDGIDPSVETAYSEEKEFEVFLQGVADIPIVTPGEDWTFDETTRVIRNEVALEDSLVSLAIDITTADQDGSESINLLLSNLPDGVIFTDSQGNEVQLSIVSIVDGKPVYQVTLEQLQDLYLKPEQDFSGLIEFNIETIVTEADGDAQRHGDDDLYNIIVEIDIQPVVDNDSSTINLTAEGKEDLLIALDFVPEEMADIDGSEVITAFIITGLEPGMTLYFDGEEITDFPVDLADYIDGTSGTLLDLMGSERFSVQAPTDATGNFKIDITYEITDTSGSGATASATFDDTMNIHVEAEVEDLLSPDNTDIDDITRLEADHSVQSSNDGSPISLEGLVDFYDADSDGSEVVDYIVIVVPAGEGWVITHPNGAISDGEGRWFIPATGLTSTNIQEVAAELLAGATIYSSHSSLLPSVVTIGARVVDGNDELMIADNIYVHFSGNTSNSSASDTSDLTNEVINGVEDENIDIGGQISNSVAGDGNDLVSFKILASDLPEGGVITGFDVIAVYDTSGKILLQYVFTEASLESLQLVGIRDDFSGTFELPITVIATDSDSGDTRTEDQVLEFEITPVVDGVELIAETTEILEDTFTELNLSACFEDSNITGEGVETITSLTLTLPEGGFLSAPDGVLTDNGDGTWTVNDLTRIDEILYKAPLNFSGDISIGYTAEVTDTAEGYNGTMTDTGTSSGTIDIEVLPVTDGATISTGTEPSQGDEDTYIDIEGLSVNLIDDDGSELMSIVITGVPEGAILVWDGGTILPNNGPDGGTFNGEPTYQWTITAEQLASLAIKPGRDFSGDITLTITVIAYEQGTSDYVTTEETFVVEVLPVGDDVQFTSIEDEFTGTEGQETYFDVSGETTETSGNETLRLTVRIAVTENSAGLVSIRIADQEAFFVEIDGYYVAILDIDSSELEGFYLNSGDAWGLFDVEIGLQSVDTATVGGEKVTDYGDITIFDSSVDLTPVVGVPELTLEADSVYVVAGSTSPLGIDLTLINPADGEIGYVEISGLPDGVSITNGTESDGVWTLSQEDLEDAQLTGLDDVGDFDLTVVSVGELDGETVAGNEQTIEVNVITDQTNISGDDEDNIIVAGAGDNVITGGEGDDQFVFNDADKGTTDAPANDSITDFTVGSDSINLTDLLRSVDASTGDELEMVLDLFEDESGSTIISVMLDGSDTVQNITLDNISLDDLYGGDASGVSESDILTKLIEDQTLITGQE